MSTPSSSTVGCSLALSLTKVILRTMLGGARLLFDCDGFGFLHSLPGRLDDIDALLDFLTDDATYADVALNMSSTGKDEIRAFFEHVQREFSSDHQFEPGHLVLGPDGYALEWVMSGTHDRDGANLRATGKSFRIRGVSVGELRDGRIARNTEYWSLVELFVQIGLMPQPGTA